MYDVLKTTQAKILALCGIPMALKLANPCDFSRHNTYGQLYLVLLLSPDFTQLGLWLRCFELTKHNFYLLDDQDVWCLGQGI